MEKEIAEKGENADPYGEDNPGEKDWHRISPEATTCLWLSYLTWFHWNF